MARSRPQRGAPPTHPPEHGPVSLGPPATHTRPATMGPAPVSKLLLAAPPRSLGMEPPEPCQLRPGLVRAAATRRTSNLPLHRRATGLLPGSAHMALSSSAARLLGQG
eukprot:30151-Prymnesium_polylepis.1